ncbi:MAG: hypothetical protein HC862_04760 [Scytonema sp. RU_4_4]|nr:hypothetical protein [Scytonema sp. RU_4_4]NJR74338.1 hypothetical protein [Scytonema sp. CRU_2_7]
MENGIDPTDKSGAWEFEITVLNNSNHAELMTLAIKHALLERDVAHLIFTDEIQTLPAGEGVKASSPEGRMTPLQVDLKGEK